MTDSARQPFDKQEASYTIDIKDEILICRASDGRRQELDLTKLSLMAIETNDSGPWGSDLWRILLDTDTNACIFSGGADGEEAVLKFMQQCLGFDNETFIQAMHSTTSKRFICWHKNRGFL